MSAITYHNHHIIPRHAGGTDASENIIRLSVADHAEAHRLLYEEYGRWQDYIAWHGLSGMIGREELHQRRSSEGGKMTKGRKYPNRKKHPPITKEHREKLSISVTGTKHPNRKRPPSFTEEHRRALREGKKRQDEKETQKERRKRLEKD